MKALLVVSFVIALSFLYALQVSNVSSLGTKRYKTGVSDIVSGDGTYYQDMDEDGYVDFIIFPLDTVPNEIGILSVELWNMGFPVDTTLPGPRVYLLQKPFSVTFVNDIIFVPKDNGKNGEWYVPRDSRLWGYWQYRFKKELKKITFT